MMNEHVEIDGGNTAAVAMATNVEERLVALHRTLKRIAKARAHLDLQEAEALREAQKLQLWKQFACTSLVDYMVQELGYSSHRVAEDRLRLANALPQLPMITQAIQNGELNMSQARELVRVATPETEKKWIEKAIDLNVREVEQAVAGHAKGDLPEDPIDPRLVRKTMWLSVRPETEVLFREARKALEKERGEKLDDDAVVEAMCRAVLRPCATTDRPDQLANVDVVGDAITDLACDGGAEDEEERVDGADATAITDRPDQSTHVGGLGDAIGDRACDEGAEEGTVEGAETTTITDRPDQSTHVGGRGVNDVLVERRAAATGAPYRVAVTVCTECKRGWQHGAGSFVEMSPPAVDAQWIGDLDSPIVERARQEISPATRRKVLHRDKGRCRVPGCRSRDNLDIHHLIHREHGGTNDLWNLITLCEAHHLAHHDGTLVITRDGDEVTFRFEGRNRFTRKTREVATKTALQERGLSREHVKAIMVRTVNEIGDSDLSEDQWLAIALRYASELAS